MLFPHGGLLSHFGQPFNDTVRPSLPTIAEPAWFAPPIDVKQEEMAITIVFHVQEHLPSELRVEASGRNLFVWGPRLPRRDQEDSAHRAMRVFALPFDAAPHDVHTSRSGDLLRVRIAKKVARVSPEPTDVPRLSEEDVEVTLRDASPSVSGERKAVAPDGHVELNRAE